MRVGERLTIEQPSSIQIIAELANLSASRENLIITSQDTNDPYIDVMSCCKSDELRSGQ